MFVVGSKRVEGLHRDVADLTRRLESVESVYDTSECFLVSTEEAGCLLGDGHLLFLAEPDQDGEVRSLVLRDVDGDERKTGTLTAELSYVRKRGIEGSVEGFVPDTNEGTIEVYAASARLTKEEDERLPLMIKHVLKKQEPREP